MKRTLALGLILLLLTGCGAPKKESRTVYAMDTVMTLTIYDTGAHADLVLSESQSEIRRLEDMLSVTAPESEIARLNQRPVPCCGAPWRSLPRQTAPTIPRCTRW